MKVEAILLGLILIGILFCLPNQSQAYVGPPYFDPLGYPSEHPWQDVESPPDEDINASEIGPRIVIIGVPTKIIMIRALQIKSNTEITRQDLRKIKFECSTTKGND